MIAVANSAPLSPPHLGDVVRESHAQAVARGEWGLGLLTGATSLRVGEGKEETERREIGCVLSLGPGLGCWRLSFRLLDVLKKERLAERVGLYASQLRLTSGGFNVQTTSIREKRMNSNKLPRLAC